LIENKPRWINKNLAIKAILRHKKIRKSDKAYKQYWCKGENSGVGGE